MKIAESIKTFQALFFGTLPRTRTLITDTKCESKKLHRFEGYKVECHQKSWVISQRNPNISVIWFIAKAFNSKIASNQHRNIFAFSWYFDRHYNELNNSVGSIISVVKRLIARHSWIIYWVSQTNENKTDLINLIKLIGIGHRNQVPFWWRYHSLISLFNNRTWLIYLNFILILCLSHLWIWFFGSSNWMVFVENLWFSRGF